MTKLADINHAMHKINCSQLIVFFRRRYMTKQADINHAMRKILVNWMVEVCEELRLSSETLYIAVSLTDR